MFAAQRLCHRHAQAPMISPRAAGTNPMIALNSVDLPAPFTPTSAVIVPRGISKLASRKRGVAVAVGTGHDSRADDAGVFGAHSSQAC